MLTEVLHEQNEKECGDVDGTEGSSNALNGGSTGWDTCRSAIIPVQSDYMCKMTVTSFVIVHSV
jgi:hypothetical protein